MFNFWDWTVSLDPASQGALDRNSQTNALILAELARIRKLMTALKDTADLAVAEMAGAAAELRSFVEYAGQLAANIKDLADQLAAVQGGANAEEEAVVMAALTQATEELKTAMEQAAAALPPAPTPEPMPEASVV